MKPVLLNAAEILHRIGYGQGESVGNDSELYWKAAGGLAIHLDLNLRFRVRSALQGAGFEEMYMFRASQFSGPQERQVSDIAPGIARGDERQFEFRLQETCFGGDLERDNIRQALQFAVDVLSGKVLESTVPDSHTGFGSEVSIRVIKGID